MGSDLYLSQGSSDHPGSNERERLIADLARARRGLQLIADGFEDWQADDGTVNHGSTELSREDMQRIAALYLQ